MTFRPTLYRRTALTMLTVATVLGTGHAGPAHAADRPDNGRITYGVFDPALGDFSIWAADPDGTDERRLTDVPSFFSDWSPDGRRIAYDFADDTGVHIATMGPNGRRVRQLTSARGVQEVPRWSPDGRWIVYSDSLSLSTCSSPAQASTESDRTALAASS